MGAPGRPGYRAAGGQGQAERHGSRQPGRGEPDHARLLPPASRRPDRIDWPPGSVLEPAGPPGGPQPLRYAARPPGGRGWRCCRLLCRQITAIPPSSEIREISMPADQAGFEALRQEVAAVDGGPGEEYAERIRLTRTGAAGGWEGGGGGGWGGGGGGGGVGGGGRGVWGGGRWWWGGGGGGGGIPGPFLP